MLIIEPCLRVGYNQSTCYLWIADFSTIFKATYVKVSSNS